MVITHGWVVDGEGRAMHKSLGNGVDPLDMIKKYGADLVSALPAYPDGGTQPNVLIKAKDCAKAEAGICIPL